MKHEEPIIWPRKESTEEHFTVEDKPFFSWRSLVSLCVVLFVLSGIGTFLIVDATMGKPTQELIVDFDESQGVAPTTPPVAPAPTPTNTFRRKPPKSPKETVTRTETQTETYTVEPTSTPLPTVSPSPEGITSAPHDAEVQNP